MYIYIFFLFQKSVSVLHFLKLCPKTLNLGIIKLYSLDGTKSRTLFLGNRFFKCCRHSLVQKRQEKMSCKY